MTKDEALRMALEALYGFIPYLPLDDEAQCGRYDKAITAIKEALAQPEKDRPQNCGTGYCSCIECVMEPEQERNFCQRCGKRLGKNDWDIHTCTPPQDKE